MNFPNVVALDAVAIISVKNNAVTNYSNYKILYTIATIRYYITPFQCFPKRITFYHISTQHLALVPYQHQSANVVKITFLKNKEASLKNKYLKCLKLSSKARTAEIT